jgi:ABC transport system ATP-binding/permease protein
MPLLVVGVMFQVILTGGIFAVAGKAGLEQVAWLSPSRWGFAGAASTVDLNVIQEPVVKAAGSVPVDPLWRHESAVWLKDVGLMLVLGLAFSAATWWRVVKIKPGRRR